MLTIIKGCLPSMPRCASVLMFSVNVSSVYALYTTLVYSPPRRPLPVPKYSSELLRRVQRDCRQSMAYILDKNCTSDQQKVFFTII